MLTFILHKNKIVLIVLKQVVNILPYCFVKKKVMEKVRILMVFWLLINSGQNIQAQFWKKITNIKNKVEDRANNKLSSQPITTSFKDVDKKKYIEDTVGNEAVFKNLHEQPFDGKCFQLVAGFYEATVASFCIKAGTYMPTSGSGRFYAPLKGPKKEIVKTIALAYQNEKKITQSNAQLLLWAIIAKTDFQRMSGSLKKVALKVLSVKQIAQLSSGSITRIGKKRLAKLMGQSNTISTILKAENKMRNMYYKGVDKYADFEKVAIIAGVEPIVTGYESGRWSKHPDGYYIRYFAKGYTKTHVQIYVPNTVKEICFNAVEDVAVPANTNSQRLLQTNLPYADQNWIKRKLNN